MPAGETPAVSEQKTGKTPAVPDMILTHLEMTREAYAEQKLSYSDGQGQLEGTSTS